MLIWFVILFPLFFLSDAKAAASRSFGRQLCEKLWLSAFNARAINYCRLFCRFKAWCLHCTGELSFLPASPITVSLYLHYLLENSLGSSTIHSAFYAINWVHKLAGFEDVNPCAKFLVKSIAEASSRVPSKPVRKAEPITLEILGLIFKQYGDSINLLDIRFICMCVCGFSSHFRAFKHYEI